MRKQQPRLIVGSSQQRLKHSLRWTNFRCLNSCGAQEECNIIAAVPQVRLLRNLMVFKPTGIVRAVRVSFATSYCGHIEMQHATAPAGRTQLGYVVGTPGKWQSQSPLYTCDFCKIMPVWSNPMSRGQLSAIKAVIDFRRSVSKSVILCTSVGRAICADVVEVDFEIISAA